MTNPNPLPPVTPGIPIPQNVKPPLHASVRHVLQFFSRSHLPKRLAAVSRPFVDLAHEVAARNPNSPETTVALRKLLEAKDAAVRAAIDPGV